MLWTCILCLSMVLPLWTEQLDIILMMFISQFQIFYYLECIEIPTLHALIFYDVEASKLHRQSQRHYKWNFFTRNNSMVMTVLIQGTLLKHFSCIKVSKLHIDFSSISHYGNISIFPYNHQFLSRIMLILNMSLRLL